VPPSFADLGVPTPVAAAIAARGITDPFPIQVATLPDAIAGRDLCGRAPTGSGKTLAFGIPLALSVDRARPHHPTGLVLVPTRELAAQVARELEWLTASQRLRITTFYGGVGFDHQLRDLRRGVDIAVACPGRLADLVQRKSIHLDEVQVAVLDEADRLADMGFLPEVRRLLDRTPDTRQTLLFSATLDGDVDTLIRRYQHNPARHELETPIDEHAAVAEHHFWSVTREGRLEVTADVVNRAGPTVVFTRTKHGADRLARQLGQRGLDTAVLHGNRSQSQRDRALQEFHTGRVHALVATDVAARGIHVDGVACVVHFDPPADHKDYVHRSGRTARAGAAGVVISLVTSEQRGPVRKMQKALGLRQELVDPDHETALADAPAHAPRRPRTEADSPRPEGRPGGHRKAGGRPDQRRGGKPGRPGAPAGRKPAGQGKSTRNGKPAKRSGQSGPAGRRGRPSAPKGARRG